MQNLMEIFKQLEKSNCRKCNQPTCLAFAAAVFQGRQQAGDCPYLDPATAARFSAVPAPNTEQDPDRGLAAMRDEIAGIDLAAAARRIGAGYAHGRLNLKVMGKAFCVDTRGRIFTDIHVHAWVAAPVFDYILTGAGKPPSGRWLPLRELASGKDWYRLFGQRCEKPLKKVADTYPDLFEDMIRLMDGRKVQNHYASDIALVLHPLPRVPILICYWKPEDGLESSLNVFFDATAEDNLSIESIYSLGTGLTTMFEKIALRHGLR